MKMLVKQLDNYFVGATLSGTPCDMLVVELVVIMLARQLDQSRFTTEQSLLDRKVARSNPATAKVSFTPKNSKFSI